MRWAHLPHAGFCSRFHTRSSPGGNIQKSTVTSGERVQNGVIIGISAVGGYKQKSSSLAPITLHTPTQTCTNTKQMNHQCGGTSPSLSLSLPVFCYSFFSVLTLSHSLALTRSFFFLAPTAHFFSHIWVLSLLNIKKNITVHGDHFKKPLRSARLPGSR